MFIVILQHFGGLFQNRNCPLISLITLMATAKISVISDICGQFFLLLEP